MFVDIDDTVGQTYGYAKKGAGRSYTGIKGLNAVLAVIGRFSQSKHLTQRVR